LRHRLSESARFKKSLIWGQAWAVTADTALRPGRFFGTTAEFRVNLQTRHDLEITRDREQAKVEREVRPIKSLVA
jgi:plasmid maintenance system antidote protein VapI